MRFSILPPFYDQPEYLDALVDSAKPYLEQDFDHLLLSFHGLPERHLHKLDPSNHCLKGADCCRTAAPEVLATCYRAQCLRSAELFAQRMGLKPEQWRSEEHTSELQSQFHLVCRLLLLKSKIFFFFNDTATTEISTLSLHDALPIFTAPSACAAPSCSLSAWGLSLSS